LNNSKKDISVVIPCYNTEPAFLSEAIDSVKKYNGRFSYEIIIVDDGSSSEQTKTFLLAIHDEAIKIIHQTNKGPAVARNNGVQKADSEFILFLDSDDRLKSGYIDEGICALKENKNAGVVYANADAFGDSSRSNFTARPFDITELLVQNYIPMTAVMRRKAWEDAGGIDENLIQYEDWEFWIRVFKAGWQFIFIDKPLFEYRIRKSSLMGQSGEDNFRTALACIYKKHWDLVYKIFHQLYTTRIMYHDDMKRPFRSFIKYAKNNLSEKRST
jgi:glycosyltransferase involved in cell wall biosynthesis